MKIEIHIDDYDRADPQYADRPFSANLVTYDDEGNKQTLDAGYGATVIEAVENLVNEVDTDGELPAVDAELHTWRQSILAANVQSPEQTQTMTARDLLERHRAGEIFEALTGEHGGRTVITGPISETTGFVLVETEFGVVRHEPEAELELVLIPNAD